LTRTYDSWAARIHPDDREKVEQALGAHLADRTPYDVTYRHRHKSGEYRWQNSRGQAIYNDEGKPVRMVGAIRDVTENVYAHEKEIELERKLQAEEEHAKLSARLQQAQKMESLAVLAGGIAHDFNNLLVGILGNAGLARSTLTPASPAMEYVRDVEAASHEAAQLIHQMLAYSGRGHFVTETLDLNALIEETTNLLSAVISKQAVLKYELEPSLPPINGDASQIRQVIMNLITNASDAIGKKSGVIAISTGVVDADAAYLAGTDFVGEAAGTYVFVEISDTGCGMDAETREKIFDPFFTTKPEGHGLGLAAVLGIVRGHKGAVRIYTEPNKGTAFKVMFPPDPAAEVTASKLSPSTGREAFRGEGLVLIVDDNETVCGVTKRVLQKVGFTVVTAADGRQGIATYKERRDDNIVCVLLDLTMPHMGGIESFRLLQQENPDVRVVLMSGYNEAEAISQFVGKGLAGFLHKPFTPEQVAEAVREVLELGPAEAE
jgi:signal transduction histidine kinase/CheY-like chemotaxis protein